MRFISIIWVLLISCNNHTSGNFGSYTEPANPSNQFTQLFTNGQHPATLIMNKDLTRTQKNVLKSFLERVSTNKQLQTEFDKFLENPELIRLENIPGLNKKETDVLLSIFIKKESSTEKGVVTISTEGKEISFKGSGRLSILDSLVIN